MHAKRFSLWLFTIISCLHITGISAIYTVHNTTGEPLYMAGYYAGACAERQTDVVEIRPNDESRIEMAQPRVLIGKRPYIVVSRSKDALPTTISIQTLRAFPHVDIQSFFSMLDRDYYLVETQGRIMVYTSLGMSRLGRFASSTRRRIKQEVGARLIDKAALPAIKNNKYRTQVAHVSVGNDLCQEEQEYVKRRKSKVCNALQGLFNMKGACVPNIAIVLSGGGNRAMFSSCGFIQGLQEIGILDITTYIAALSGSTWFLGSWYASGEHSVAAFRKKLANTMKRGIGIASSHAFNLMLDAFKVKYVYDQPITNVDLFGALLGNALLDDHGDKRYQVYLSDQKDMVMNGDLPFPIYTAVDGSKITHRLERWYEFTPYEVGGAWLNHYIPTWAFGRRFVRGVSVDDEPEMALAFLFGLFGSAFAVDIYRAWQEVEKSVTLNKNIREFVEQSLLNHVGDRRLTQYEEFNFTAGMPSSQLRDQKNMVFVDGGFAFNLPYPPVSGERVGRMPNVLIFFDASRAVSFIKTDPEGAASELRKVEAYARRHNLKFPNIDKVLPNMVNVYKDESDPTVPVVIWIPCTFDAARWKDAHEAQFKDIKGFDLSACITKFCETTNFKYTYEQAEKLMKLGQFCAYACKDEIVEAIKWKIDQFEA